MQDRKQGNPQNRMVAERPTESTIFPSQTYNPIQGEQWFGELIHTIKTHKLQLETITASPVMEKFYNIMLGGDQISQCAISKELLNKQLTAMAVVEYLEEIEKSGRKPLRLAFNIADSKLRVWAVLEDDDEETEDALIMAEAAVNAKLSKAHFRITSTMVEASDNLPVPSHYKGYITE